MLKLDEIERTDDKLNQIKKRLINYTQLLSDKLEAKALMNEKSNVQAESTLINTEANEAKLESKAESNSSVLNEVAESNSEATKNNV